MAKQKDVKPCDCKYLCKKYAPKDEDDYGADMHVMENCPHFKAQPPRNLGTITFRMKNGDEFVVRPDDVKEC